MRLLIGIILFVGVLIVAVNQIDFEEVKVERELIYSGELLDIESDGGSFFTEPKTKFVFASAIFIYKINWTGSFQKNKVYCLYMEYGGGGVFETIILEKCIVRVTFPGNGTSPG